jgi:divalent metal cation (Fe/Co/Zn/Cd) transporter
VASLALSLERRETLRRAVKLETFTLGWNLVETLVGLVAGLAAGSIALIGFALDSVVESSSAAILVWRLRTESSGRRSAEDAERKAVKMVAAGFFALSAYVGIQSLLDLVTRSKPEASPLGIGLAGVSLVVMPLLALRKRAAARSLDSRSLHADSRQTWLCSYLSAFLLAGLIANGVLGWWWADPLAGLAIAVYAGIEGRRLWLTEDLCCV